MFRLPGTRQILRFSLGALFFIFAFRLAIKTPLMTETYFLIEGLVIVGLVGIFILYCLNGALKRHLPHHSLWWSSIVFSLMVLWSGLAALHEFNQPLLYGVLAQRQLLLCLLGPLLFIALRKEVISLATIERLFVFLAWTTAIVYLVLINSLDPHKYDDVHGFVSYDGLRGGYRFHFNVAFIVFGAIYYFVRSLLHVRLSTIGACLFFFSYLVAVHLGRTVLVTLAASLGLMIIYSAGSKQRLRFLLFIVPAVVLATATALLMAPDLVSTLLRLFESAFSAIDGTRGQDASANARIWEMTAAMRYIVKNPMFGNGELSYQWNGGFMTVMGRFYTADIGLFGTVFVYGLMGLLLLNMPYLWIARYARIVRCRPEQQFLYSLKTFCLFFFLNSLVTGGTVFYAATVFLIFAIFAFNYELVVGAEAIHRYTEHDAGISQFNDE